MTYSAKIGGYIADVPEIWFRRCDGRIFHFTELTNATMTINQNNTEITAGWSLFPVAVLPGTSTLEVSFTSAKFEPELFAMTNSVEMEDAADYEEYMTETLTVATGSSTAVLTNEPVEYEEDGLTYCKVSIPGLTQVDSTDTPEDDEFKVDSATKTITFGSALTADATMEISYVTEVATGIQEMKIDNRAAAIGEVVEKYPVYSDGTDCTAAGIIGYAFLKIYQARITAQPSLGGSYKSAATYDFTISAIDPKGKGGQTASGNDAVYAIGFKKA